MKVPQVPDCAAWKKRFFGHKERLGVLWEVFTVINISSSIENLSNEWYTNATMTKMTDEDSTDDTIKATDTRQIVQKTRMFLKKYLTRLDPTCAELQKITPKQQASLHLVVWNSNLRPC